ncbi:hypothetical protein [Anaerophaga thermohalophila]|uniref:hypothetical protein n=1 Tax=Anaerophaga thermohalophila TaxID=177400 RepID=UPI000300D0E1|nr:hypothetical protein [Anaerophaga thermohalophila]
MTRWKNIALFLLWMAGLVIFLHEVIPHHHHFHSVYVNVPVAGDSTSCEYSHGHNEPFDDARNHCHAFNDITVERNSIVKISQPWEVNDSNLFLLYVTSAVDDESGNRIIRVFIPNSPSLDIFILSVFPHRGPPLA